MERLSEFMWGVASHWFLLSVAIGSFLASQFVHFEVDSKAVPILIAFGLACFILVLYLTATEPLMR